MSAKCVKSYFNAFVFLSFCYCEVKIYSLFFFIFTLIVCYYYSIDYVSKTIYSDI